MNVGFALGGSWMKGHRVVVVRWKDPVTKTLSPTAPSRVYLDGKEILQAKGSKYKGRHIQTSDRYKGSDFDLRRVPARKLKLTPEELKELGWAKSGKWYERYKSRNGILISANTHHFVLPNGVEIFFDDSGKAMSLIIKMHAVAGQVGYCGNFNGEVKDDSRVKRVVSAGESWFEAVSSGRSSSIQVGNTGTSGRETDRRKTRQQKHGSLVMCSPQLLQKASRICNHIPEQRIREDCKYDVCATGDLSLADASINMEVLEVKTQHGMIRFEGEGHCLDAHGKTYTEFKADGTFTDQQCQDILQSLASTNGVRGAEVSPSQECFIAVDLDINQVVIDGWRDSGFFRPHRPGLGTGIVSKTTGTEGWSCWQLI